MVVEVTFAILRWSWAVGTRCRGPVAVVPGTGASARSPQTASGSRLVARWWV